MNFQIVLILACLYWGESDMKAVLDEKFCEAFADNGHVNTDKDLKISSFQFRI